MAAIAAGKVVGLGCLAADLELAGDDLRIENVDRITVKLPYRKVPERAMDRELPHWRYVEICIVHLRGGQSGVGETLIYYTWGATGDDDVRRVLGQNAAEWMWDDSLGAGLQIALVDAVARTLGVPIHALVGTQVHRQTPISWWNIDMPPADMVAECLEAHRAGYTAYKTKGRPWFDIWQQVDDVARALPESFQVDMDFNRTLLDAPRAIPILQDLDKYTQIKIYEEPINPQDIAGHHALRAATRTPIALHDHSPPMAEAIRANICDGFVIRAGMQGILQRGALAAAYDKPFWLQLVGSDITAAFSLQMAAVLSHARWPAVNCHQLYDARLLTRPIVVAAGFAEIPNAPGLGFELDRDAVERLRVPKPASRPDPPRLVRTRWLSGRTMYVSNHAGVNFMLNLAAAGKLPFYERGVDTDLFPDDGSSRWRQLYERARDGPVFE
jgi:galactonate dehydratase